MATYRQPYFDQKGGIPLIAREGYIIIAVVVLLAVILAAAGLLLPTPLGWLAVALGVALVAFSLYFFRDPKRSVPAHIARSSALLAPADGKVVLVQEVDEPLYLKGPAKQVSIFLSPLNVHVNRIPADGTIEYVNYVPGSYLVAWHPKASALNERSEIGLLHEGGSKVLFKQIAGAVARRIVYHVKVGDTVQAGDRFGIVRFGSRMDVLVPPSAEIDVKVGDRVTAGITPLGRIASAEPAVAAVTEQRGRSGA